MADLEDEIFDVAVIGGGPAGSTAATFLAKAGRRVVVLEKERFPRFHIGESLLPYNIPLLAELGVLDAIERSPAMPKHGAQFVLGDGSESVEFRFRNGSFTEQTSSFQVERSVFDKILLDRAAELGAEVREGCLVAKYETADDGITFTVGDGETVRARFLIDASGTANFTGNREKLREDHAHLKKVAVFGHFQDVLMSDGQQAGDIIIIRCRDAWCWLIPLSSEKVSVGLVVDRAVLRTSKLSPEELLEKARSENSELARRMNPSTPVTPLRTITDFSYYNREIVGDRAVRVGDAAGFLDPIFSSGVYLAMVSGKAGALAADKALSAGVAMHPAMERYAKEARRNLALYRDMIEKFYEPEMIEVMLQPQPFFRVPAAVNAILAGRLDQRWYVRWRLWVFFLLVRMQKRFAFLPRVAFLREPDAPTDHPSASLRDRSPASEFEGDSSAST